MNENNPAAEEMLGEMFATVGSMLTDIYERLIEKGVLSREEAIDVLEFRTRDCKTEWSQSLPAGVLARIREG